MIATRRRVPALFAFDVRDCIGANGKLIARSYGTELEGVFTRAGVKWMTDQNGLLVPRVHSMPPLGCVLDESGNATKALLMEPAATNLDLRSQEFDHAAWVKTRCSVTANAALAPDGTLTGDRLIEDATAANSHYLNPNTARTITANAVVTASRFFKAGTRTWARIFVSGGGGTNSFSRYLNLATGALGSATTGGTGTHIGSHVESWTAPDGGQWWRLVVTGTVGSGETAVSALTQLANADFGAVYDGDGVSYFDAWGAQFEEGYGSSYIPTTSAAVARVTDSLYFDFAALPQAMTVYVRGVEQGLYTPASGVNRTVLNIGAANPATVASFRIGKGSGDTHFAQHNNGIAVSSQASVGTPSAGDLVEHRGVLAADGSVVSGFTVNEGAESVATASAATALGASWAAGVNRIYLTGGLTANNGAFAYQQVVIAAGIKTMDEMRALAGVA